MPNKNASSSATPPPPTKHWMLPDEDPTPLQFLGDNPSGMYSLQDLTPSSASPTSAAIAASPAAAEIQAASPPSAQSQQYIGSMIWNSPWRYVVLAGIAAAIGVLAYHLFMATKSSDSNSLTPAQGHLAQQVVSQELSATDSILKSQGDSATTIAQAHNEVQIEYGTRIALATLSSDGFGTTSQRVTVTGNTMPSQYATLVQLNASGYVATISRHPTPSDVTDNSVVVHNLTGNQQ